MDSSSSKGSRSYLIIVEHLDPELEDWQALEYKCIAEESRIDNCKFLLSGLNSASEAQELLGIPAGNLTEKNVESLYPVENQRKRVCLLDPKAEHDLSPDDGDTFDVFLFGGILGDDPPRDRTGELRKLGIPGRRLGIEQMTTDTAARVTRLVVQEKSTWIPLRSLYPFLSIASPTLGCPSHRFAGFFDELWASANLEIAERLKDIPYVDRPDIELPGVRPENESNATESVSMPFRYVKRDDGTPIMPKGMVELLANDAEKNILDLL